MVRIILDTRRIKAPIRADRAWAFFCGPRRSLRGAREYWAFSNWLWDEFGEKAGSLNEDSRGIVRVAIPHLRPDALDLVVRLASFWANDVRLQKGERASENLWTPPTLNLLDDQARKGAARALFGSFSEDGSKELNLMPLLGPGRAFFSLQLIEKGDSSARMHSHSAVDEYYLILDGRGTLRFNGRAIEVGKGDLIAKPTGPDAATHLNADRGEALRVLDMEIWHVPFKGTGRTSKDLMLWPDHQEVGMRGPGWGAILSRRSLLPSSDAEKHWSESYVRAPDGMRKPVPRRRRAGRT
jgi:uncharacterized cupin superfamily protein